MKTCAQLALALAVRGGRRSGAGRKPKGLRPLVSHKARRHFRKPPVVHVTLRVAARVWNLRSHRCFRRIEGSLERARERFGLRVVEFTVLGNHLHLIVEADSSEALSRGMQGLSIRLAKALNRLMRSGGHVFADHYHSRVLATPTEVVNAIAYVLGNFAHHFGGSAVDLFSSGSYDATRRERVLASPVTWLLRTGWRRARRRFSVIDPRVQAVHRVLPAHLPAAQPAPRPTLAPVVRTVVRTMSDPTTSTRELRRLRDGSITSYIWIASNGTRHSGSQIRPAAPWPAAPFPPGPPTARAGNASPPAAAWPGSRPRRPPAPTSTSASPCCTSTYPRCASASTTCPRCSRT